ncbi:RnfH family protein [Photobacterium carnosum]|uniref:RnfH family protein n=1 Tax=Photobacterium carnosum TaxID=2023717 RepID=UPI00128B2EC5|nr:RnfH family protein [Photobacterium carnosum]KAE8177048.1 RnfH family protein [Photobacterium carnosum]MCD9499358.1 RnfH family protein [Photobacterium carnosum]MCD9514204.1 RnfH family protein [Photobacterium carnosum]MCD9528398.1 RnfH family protein [Photobacterium carnosum]MCD9537376.1 RnfH family protein [Photobacterium carnosum]
MHSDQPLIHVEVVFALPNVQRVLKLAVVAETPIQAIIEQSGILTMYPEIDLNINKIGIYSRNVKLDATARDGDRIEIYRPLVADPREIRRKRAEQAKKDAEK